MTDSPLESLSIAALCNSREIWAYPDGLRFLAINEADKTIETLHEWVPLKNPSRLGVLLGQRMANLIEQEIVLSDERGLVLPFANLPLLDEIDFDFLAGVVKWSPYTVRISADGTLGYPDFGFKYSFIFGRQQTFGKRVGPFYQRNRTIWRLSPRVYSLLETIDQFNSLPSTSKTKEAALSALGRVREFSVGSGLDEYLNSEEVVIPSKVKIDIQTEQNGLVSLIPQFDGVNNEELAKQFLKFSNVQSVYDLPSAAGKRCRVVVNEDLKNVLIEMQKIRHVGGDTRDRVLADVRAVLGEGIDQDLIDVAAFAPRVKGIGEPPIRARLWIQRPPRDWGDSAGIGGIVSNLSLNVEEGGKSRIIKFDSSEEVIELQNVVEEAIQLGKASVQFKGNKILVDDELLGSVKEASGIIFESGDKGDRPQPKYHPKNCRYLLIYSNEEMPEYSEGSIGDQTLIPHLETQIPRSLRRTFINQEGETLELKLKSYQKEGIRWLQYLFLNREHRRGCLLADDMGLGKTLQILAFLAWCVEDGYAEGLGAETGPYEPILIVAPLILLQNWADEMEKYFDNDIFGPTLILHDRELKRLISRRDPSKEVALGSPKLDLEALRSNRVVITNYDTVKNYQHSFGRVPWSVIITDEAQEFKEQNSRSDALKSLRCLFKIVATGTPVENRLLDLWNLVDYMQPGSLLGSSKNFSDLYEKDITEKTEEERIALSSELRSRLFYGREDAFLLRRDKEGVLPDLPKKNEHTIKSPLSETQRKTHIQLVQALSNSDNENHHFKILHCLRKLYLHPFLLDGQPAIENASHWIAASPKLQSVVNTINEIKKRQEKVLVFALLQDMQSVLQQVLGSVFDIEIDVINGAPNSRRSSNMEFRKELISKFSKQEGFNILILSPRVAGVGLTITAANHVIHYERWWNPAKEAQATDRAYRIGQKRDVSVYYPVSIDSTGQFTSFDEKLNSLLQEKKQMAKDFLLPSSKAQISESEFINNFKVPEKIPNYRETSGTDVVSSLEAAQQLNGHQFEALLSVLYERQGYSVVICPVTRDGGADLVAVNLKEVILIQCKHTSSDFPVVDDAVGDLLDA